MGAPTNTYNSNTTLSLSNTPKGDWTEDQYEELLDLHDAIEKLLTASDDADAVFAAYIAKQRNNTSVSNNYTIVVTDGTIEVDASLNDVTITMPPITDIEGYRFDIKRVDQVPANTVIILGDGAELIDDRATGIKVSTKSSYTVKANDTGWNII